MSSNNNSKKYVVKVMGLTEAEYKKLEKLTKEGETVHDAATRIVKNYLKNRKK